MIRYHSYYAAHTEGDYEYFMDEFDHAMLSVVRQFNPYDLYSKADEAEDVEALKPFYLELLSKYFPAKIEF